MCVGVGAYVCALAVGWLGGDVSPILVVPVLTQLACTASFEGTGPVSGWWGHPQQSSQQV